MSGFGGESRLDAVFVAAFLLLSQGGATVTWSAEKGSSAVESGA